MNKLSLITILNIYPIKRILLSMLRPSNISSMYTALYTKVPVEDRRRYMKFEREVVVNTGELYNFISSGYKVFIAGLEIDRIKRRIEDPNSYYVQYPDFKYLFDKVWIIIVKDNINEVSTTTSTNVRQLEPLNISWHNSYCRNFTPLCTCNKINITKPYKYLLNHDNVWYKCNEFEEDNVILYYHPGRQYMLSLLSIQNYRPYVRILDHEIRDLSNSNSNSNNLCNIQYIDIEDNSQSIQFSRSSSSVSTMYREIQIYYLTNQYMPKIVYI